MLITEKERLEGHEKYKAFLMYQDRDNDVYLKDAIRDYFKTPLYFLYDYDDIRGLGIKFCKICKLTQACDFGIAVLSPENENVFMEVGLLIGMGKPCLYIVNESRLRDKDIRKLPFDISDQIVVKYDSKKKLLSELEKETPVFMLKVQLLSGYEKALRENIKERLKRLSPEGNEALKKIITFGKVTFTDGEYQPVLGTVKGKKDIGTLRSELANLKFVSYHIRQGIHRGELVYSVEEAYRPILEELLFSD